MLEVVLSLTRCERSAKICHNSRSTHFYTNPHILSSGFLVQHLLIPLVCFTSILFRLRTLNFSSTFSKHTSSLSCLCLQKLTCTFSKYTSSLSCLCLQELTCLVEEQNWPTLQRFRAVACTCSDFEMIELKQQFCGNRQTYTYTQTN